MYVDMCPQYYEHYRIIIVVPIILFVQVMWATQDRGRGEEK